MVPADYDPATAFAHYSNQGVLYRVGTPLTIPSGQTISGKGVFSINDHVNCQGSFSVSNLAVGNTITSGTINLNNGLTFSGTGIVDLGNGILTVEDTTSGMSGGTLSGVGQYVGYSGTGVFSQSGGQNSLLTQFYLGYNEGATGTYNLSDAGSLESDIRHFFHQRRIYRLLRNRHR